MSTGADPTPQNAKAAHAQRVRQELSRLLDEPGEDGAQNLRKILEAVVKEAREGNLAAAKEILDRVVGRSVVAPDDDPPSMILISWKQNTPSYPPTGDSEGHS